MKKKKNNFFYPLTKERLNTDDINSGIKTLRSKNITMGKKTLEIENYFSKKIMKRDSLMVNSGSSANLLIFQALINPKINLLKKGDKILIPAVCWSTSLWPIIQSGLKPIFVDIDEKTLNISVLDLKKKINKQTKGLMLVHALGNCAEMDEVVKICKEKKLILIEDTCEALGSKFKKKYLGTFGDFSSFSMYYSHHITSGEGGFVTSKLKKNINLLKVLRSHGWEKEIKKSKNNWRFINSGFNLRPTDINASIGLSQLKRLKQILSIRNQNYNLLKKILYLSKQFKNQFEIITSSKSKDVAWFGIAIILNKNFIKLKNNIIIKLNKSGIETRPIISGNFANQPAIKLYNIFPGKLINADKIEKSGFFLGLHNTILKKKELKKFEKIFFDAFI